MPEGDKITPPPPPQYNVRERLTTYLSSPTAGDKIDELINDLLKEPEGSEILTKEIVALKADPSQRREILEAIEDGFNTFKVFEMIEEYLKNEENFANPGGLTSLLDTLPFTKPIVDAGIDKYKQNINIEMLRLMSFGRV